jgi:hypothetical protein
MAQRNWVTKIFIFFAGAAFFTYLISCNGQMGPEGDIGPAGLSSLLRMTEEPPGANCEFGGTRIESGLDSNLDGMLNDDEVTSTQFVCNGESQINEPALLAQVGFGYNNNQGFVTNSNAVTWSWFQNDTRYHLINFNKRDYPGADSIVVAMRLTTRDSNARAFGDLYDVTNSQPIPNTQLESTVVFNENTDPTYVFSGNIYNDMPDSETAVSIALRVRSEVVDVPVSGGPMTYIFIYRQ